MARTVDNHSTLEDFRRQYNDLANDVGAISGLRTTEKSNIIDALNSLEDKSFFLQEYIFTGSDGTNGNTRFTGVDNFGYTLQFVANRIQVFKNGVHLFEGDDYSLGNVQGDGTYNRIDLVSAAANSDKIVIYSFTGSYLGFTGQGSASVGYFSETAANTIYNTNDNGLIFNGDGATKTTLLTTSAPIEFDGEVYFQNHINLPSGALVKGDVQGDVVGNVTGTVSSITNHNLASLGNVDASSPNNGQMLIYNSSTTNWESADAPANYTDEQAQDAVASAIAAGTHTNITVSYDDANNTISFTGSNSVTGGDGLDLTGTTMSVNTSNGIKTDSDNVVLDYETVSSAPSSVGSTSNGHLWFVI